MAIRNDPTTDRPLGTDAGFSRGYDAGNYAAAYESESYERVAPQNATRKYAQGFLLGFYSSYELHEIPAQRRGEVAALRAKYPNV